MRVISGGGFTNLQCMIFGGLAIVGFASGNTGAGLGLTGAATAGGCFEAW